MTQKEERAPAPCSPPLALAQGGPRDAHARVTEAEAASEGGYDGRARSPLLSSAAGRAVVALSGGASAEAPPTRLPGMPGTLLPPESLSIIPSN